MGCFVTLACRVLADVSNRSLFSTTLSLSMPNTAPWEDPFKTERLDVACPLRPTPPNTPSLQDHECLDAWSSTTITRPSHEDDGMQAPHSCFCVHPDVSDSAGIVTAPCHDIPL